VTHASSHNDSINHGARYFDQVYKSTNSFYPFPETDPDIRIDYKYKNVAFMEGDASETPTSINALLDTKVVVVNRSSVGNDTIVFHANSSDATIAPDTNFPSRHTTPSQWFLEGLGISSTLFQGLLFGGASTNAFHYESQPNISDAALNTTFYWNEPTIDVAPVGNATTLRLPSGECIVECITSDYGNYGNLMFHFKFTNIVAAITFNETLLGTASGVFVQVSSTSSCFFSSIH
jgi:hypothetical protein